MAHRKRTAEEQRLFDELEVLREQRRALAAKRDVAFSEFDALNRKHDNAAILQRGLAYLYARDAVKDIDEYFATKKATYNVLRAVGDAEVDNGK